MAGNFGGNSIPTTPISGGTLYNGRNTTYKDWKCTNMVTNATSGIIYYEGLTIPIAKGQTLEFLLTPSKMTATPDAVIFFCYECGCSSSMTGTTAPSGFYSGTTQMFRPTIIGGDGLNS